MHAWPLIYATALITIGAVVIGTVFALLSAMFIVEFAPDALRRVLEPVVRLLAAVPSVIYGLIGILVLVPFVGNHIISQGAKDSVAGVISLERRQLGVGILILTVMITPIMIAIVVDALRAVPIGWREGSVSLGVNRWRAMWTVSVRAARPAIVAAAVLATARALGEAIMLSMVTGSVGFAPNPLDGIIFFVEPARPLAATIVDNSEGLSVVPVRADPLCLRGGAAGLGRLPVLRRLVHPAPPAPLHALADMSTPATSEQEGREPAALAAPRRRRSCRARGFRAATAGCSRTRRSSPGASATGSAWPPPGSPACCSARSPASIVIYMLVRGLQYVNLSAIGEHPVVQSTTHDHRHQRAATWIRSRAP